jgi:hypothetical protein
MTSGDAGPHGPHVMDVTFRNAGEITVSLRANGKWPVSRKESALTDTPPPRARVDADHGQQRQARPPSSAYIPLTCGPVTAAQVVAAAVRRSNGG